MTTEEMIQRKTMSVNQACELMHVSRRTLYNWMGDSKVEYIRTAGGSRRIFCDTLWKDSNDSTPNDSRIPSSVASD